MKNPRPVLLAIETATSSCSAALSVDGEVCERIEVGQNIHSQVLLSMINELFQESALEVGQLDAVAVGQGPGSFTGLRIGIGVAQGIAYGADCPMIGVSSLDALALQAATDGRVLATIDARMGEIYWGEYQLRDRQLNQLQPYQVSPARDISVDCNAVLVGNAWAEYKAQFSTDLRSRITWLEHVVFPKASAMLEIAHQKYLAGELLSAAAFSPTYVRDNVAKKAKPKH